MFMRQRSAAYEPERASEPVPESLRALVDEYVTALTDIRTLVGRILEEQNDHQGALELIALMRAAILSEQAKFESQIAELRAERAKTASNSLRSEGDDLIRNLIETRANLILIGLRQVFLCLDFAKQ
jgi:hypothetical protein